MSIFNHLLLTTSVLALSACNTQDSNYNTAPETSYNTTFDTPAVFTHHSPQGLAELTAIVSAALDKKNVTLAQNTFTTSSMLVIERKPRRDSSGQLIMGRSYEIPQKFDLVLNQGSCYLLHERSNRRWLLRKSECKAL